MSADLPLLSIGQFARACGLTAKALRHYDAIGLLAPAVVEQGTGYRRYHPDQVDQARLIRKLRAVELPIAEVRRLLGLYQQDADSMTAELAEHRRRLDSRVTRLQHQIHQIDHLIHAQKTLDICQRHDIRDFGLAFAYEALARAAAVGRDGDESRRWAELARAAAAEIAGDFDRELLLSDLETIPTAV